MYNYFNMGSPKIPTRSRPEKLKTHSQTIIITDKSRRRRLALTVFSPRKTGVFPCIVFSPGTNVSVQAYEFLGYFWSSRGYVCLFPQHHGKSERLSQPTNWITRRNDIAFAIDSLPLISRRLRKLKIRVDESRIGIGGHSHGAHTSLLCAGAKLESPKGVFSDLREARARAFLALSPPGANCLGITHKSYRSVNSPLLTMSGTLDRDLHFKKPASWRWDPFKGAASKDKFHALIEGATHYGFFEAVTIHEDSFEIPRKKTLHLIQRLSLMFWDAYLKNRKANLTRLKKHPNIHAK